MTATDPLSDEQLQEFQNDMFNGAKKELMEDGHIEPMTFILMKKMEVDEWLRQTIVDASTWFPPADDGSTPNDYIFLIVPCRYDDNKTIVHMLKYLSNNPAMTSKMFDFLIAMAPAFGQKDPYEKIVQTFKTINGLNIHNKDIVASFLKTVCKRTEAIAYVKIDEAWYKDAKLPEDSGVKTLKDAQKYVPHGSLEDDVDAKEMLMCYLETRTIKKHISEAFERDVRHTGKVLGWGKKNVLLDDGKSDHKLDGRFCHLLQPRGPNSELVDDEG